MNTSSVSLALGSFVNSAINKYNWRRTADILTISGLGAGAGGWGGGGGLGEMWWGHSADKPIVRETNNYSRKAKQNKTKKTNV